MTVAAERPPAQPSPCCAVYGQTKADAAHEMALTDPERAEQQHVGAAIKLLLAFHQRGDVRVRVATGPSAD